MFLRDQSAMLLDQSTYVACFGYSLY